MTDSDDLKLRVAALNDVFMQIGKCSEGFQNVQMLPWEKLSIWANLSDQLTEMKEELLQTLDEMKSKSHRTDQILEEHNIAAGLTDPAWHSLCLKNVKEPQLVRFFT